MARTRTRKPKLRTLVDKAWASFSAYTRKRHADFNGFIACVSCGVPKHYTEMHAGHFVHCSRQSRLSYDERNVHPQCRQCNFYGMQGMAAIRYTEFMINRYGKGIINELEAIKHEKDYLKRPDLEAIIETYGDWTK